MLPWTSQGNEEAAWPHAWVEEDGTQHGGKTSELQAPLGESDFMLMTYK